MKLILSAILCGMLNSSQGQIKKFYGDYSCSNRPLANETITINKAGNKFEYFLLAESGILSYARGEIKQIENYLHLIGDSKEIFFPKTVSCSENLKNSQINFNIYTETIDPYISSRLLIDDTTSVLITQPIFKFSVPAAKKFKIIAYTTEGLFSYTRHSGDTLRTPEYTILVQDNDVNVVMDVYDYDFVKIDFDKTYFLKRSMLEGKEATFRKVKFKNSALTSAMIRRRF